MREPGEIVAALPRPGRALKFVLAFVAIFALAGAIVLFWAPGGPRGAELFKWLAFQPKDRALLYQRPWTVLTSGFLTLGFGHAIWSLVGLYFLTTDLEHRWGGWRMLRFLALGVIVGNVTVLAASFIPHDLFQPGVVCGPLAAITATAIAWSKENAQRQIRFMFFLPMSGRTLYWLTIAIAVLAIIFAQGASEGAVAPLGGVFAGLLFSGTPSPVRAAWLRFRLMILRRRGAALTVESLTGEPPRSRPSSKRGGKGPPLRIVHGGLEEDLKNRKPPKDKRYLN